MAKHMDSAVRGQIQFWIESHRSVAWIARALGKPPSTVWREILNHRIPSDKGYGCSNRLCAKFDACTRPSYGATDYKALAKNRPGCFEACPDFREAVCGRLAGAPFVCNGCEKERSCPPMKRFYFADGAQAAYRSALVNSRSGVHPDDEAVAKMGAAVRDGLGKGQSVRHILRARTGSCSRATRTRPCTGGSTTGCSRARDAPCSRSRAPAAGRTGSRKPGRARSAASGAP